MPFSKVSYVFALPFIFFSMNPIFAAETCDIVQDGPGSYCKVELPCPESSTIKSGYYQQDDPVTSTQPISGYTWNWSVKALRDIPRGGFHIQQGKVPVGYPARAAQTVYAAPMPICDYSGAIQLGGLEAQPRIGMVCTIEGDVFNCAQDVGNWCAWTKMDRSPDVVYPCACALTKGQYTVGNPNVGDLCHTKYTDWQT